ncbi:unnamed protein product [Parascedosporium putredinis]|uniref:Glucanase n=1 Tax=Parascedosporium putredinis TaxID=1442378 RepID=A0A9P1H444_9PEZI|nr:unnamed protein product [Parascedosporium putredinis]CAI7995293.1 unnamed protein product [Parascedosporium putredinis]
MKVTAATLALAAVAAAAPSQTLKESPRAVAAECASAVTLDASTNIWKDYKLHANNFYRSEIEEAVTTMSDDALAAQALKVADIGTFVWVDTRSAIERLKTAVEGVPCEEILGVVIYDLPGRDCAAKASNGELKVGEIDIYKNDYIDPIVEVLKSKPNTAFALVIEPDSLPNLITNIDLQTCQDSADGYRDGVAYALKQLNLPNVVMYMDAGRRQPSQFRGIATNVAGWNQWDLSPGEFSDATDAEWNKCQNEKIFVETFGASLKSAGMPNHAIVDTGRNGVSGLREEWGNWCNVAGAGFGIRPSADTGSELADAFVWVKPGGESDGTSDESATRYDSYCGKPDAFKPSPEAGQWSQTYFETLIKNAKPAF